MTRDHAAELDARMRAPQRHRLLQGYPMAPLMQPLAPGDALDVEAHLDPRRPLLVGVLPHPYCNPRVRGCGFCTFPHEAYSRAGAHETTRAVGLELERTLGCWPELGARRVDALYFGGGTANLTPPADFSYLAERLSRSFDLTGAEITLEGVPRYFLSHDAALTRTLAAMPARRRRVSMGVQTFDRALLERMGRLAFGDRTTIERAVALAHGQGMTASADLLFALPGAARERALLDVETAAAIGFEQICLYNLVVYEGLGTPWSEDAAVLASLPSQEERLVTWLELRERLLTLGYVQSTLTNFERADVYASDRCFAYEAMSFQPARYDGLGLGPAAISCFSAGQRALKWQNEGSAAAYARAVSLHGRAWRAAFDYDATDLRLLHVTRSLAGLTLSLSDYARRFGTRLEDDFAAPLEAIVARRLLVVRGDTLRWTPTGMFFADSALGLLAAVRAPQRRGLPLADAAPHHMG
jgi:coproporphyrinogen III oxidase-like Fe-S oxidoreductase